MNNSSYFLLFWLIPVFLLVSLIWFNRGKLQKRWQTRKQNEQRQLFGRCFKTDL